MQYLQIAVYVGVPKYHGFVQYPQITVYVRSPVYHDSIGILQLAIYWDLTQYHGITMSPDHRLCRFVRLSWQYRYSSGRRSFRSDNISSIVPHPKSLFISILPMYHGIAYIPDQCLCWLIRGNL